MSSLKLLIVVTLGWHAILVHQSPEVRRTSQLPELSNLQVYNNTLYVGGLDKLYSFDENLNVLQSVDTCSGLCEYNYNKVLLLNETGQELIICGTDNRGICERRLLANLSSVVHSSSYRDMPWYEEMADMDALVVGSDRNRPAIALMWDKRLILFAVTYGENIPFSCYSNDYDCYNAMTLRTTF